MAKTKTKASKKTLPRFPANQIFDTGGKPFIMSDGSGKLWRIDLDTGVITEIELR